MLKHATSVAPLDNIGKFLVEIGMLIEELIRSHPNCSYYCDSNVIKIKKVENKNCWKIIVHDTLTKKTFERYAVHVVLATGGSQVLPRLPSPFHTAKLMSSDDVCTQSGVNELKVKLNNPNSRRRVVIIGGAHSAFSAAWICLNKLGWVKPTVALQGGALPSGVSPNVYIIHRTPVKVFYCCKRDADKDKYTDYQQVNGTGQIHPFGGLRGDAKALYRNIKNGNENRVRLICTGSDGSNHSTMVQKLFDDASVIVWACGYGSNIIPVTDECDRYLTLSYRGGQVEVDNEARVLAHTNVYNSGMADGASTTMQGLSGSKSTHNSVYAVPNLYATGLGYGLKTSLEIESRADGVAVYQKRGATSILAHIIGTKVFGTGAHTWEQHVELNMRSFQSDEEGGEDGENEGRSDKREDGSGSGHFLRLDPESPSNVCTQIAKMSMSPIKNRAKTAYAKSPSSQLSKRAATPVYARRSSNASSSKEAKTLNSKNSPNKSKSSEPDHAMIVTPANKVLMTKPNGVFETSLIQSPKGRLKNEKNSRIVDAFDPNEAVQVPVLPPDGVMQKSDTDSPSISPSFSLSIETSTTSLNSPSVSTASVSEPNSVCATPLVTKKEVYDTDFNAQYELSVRLSQPISSKTKNLLQNRFNDTNFNVSSTPTQVSVSKVNLSLSVSSVVDSAVIDTSRKTIPDTKIETSRKDEKSDGNKFDVHMNRSMSPPRLPSNQIASSPIVKTAAGNARAGGGGGRGKDDLVVTNNSATGARHRDVAKSGTSSNNSYVSNPPFSARRGSGSSNRREILLSKSLDVSNTQIKVPKDKEKTGLIGNVPILTTSTTVASNNTVKPIVVKRSHIDIMTQHLVPHPISLAGGYQRSKHFDATSRDNHVGIRSHSIASTGGKALSRNPHPYLQPQESVKFPIVSNTFSHEKHDKSASPYLISSIQPLKRILVIKNGT